MLAKSPPLSHAQSEVLKDATCQCTKKNPRTILIGKKVEKINTRFNEQATDAKCIYDGIERVEAAWVAVSNNIANIGGSDYCARK